MCALRIWTISLILLRRFLLFGLAAARRLRIGVGLALALAFRLRFALRFARWLILFSRLLVRLAAVVGLVKARAFEDDSGAGAEEAAEFGLLAVGALLLDGLRDRLEELERVSAGVAFVIVSGHGRKGTGYGELGAGLLLGRVRVGGNAEFNCFRIIGSRVGGSFRLAADANNVRQLVCVRREDRWRR